MVGDSGAHVLLTQSSLLDRVGDAGAAATVCLDTGWPSIATNPDEPPPSMFAAMILPMAREDGVV